MKFDNFSFAQMETHYSAPTAYDILLKMEKVVGIKSWAVAEIDPEIRLASALRAHDAMCAASLTMQLAA